MTRELNRAKGWLAALRATLLPTCREMSRHASHSLDTPLPILQRLGVGLHLLFCKFCRRYRKQLRWLRVAAHEAATAPVPRLSDSGRNRLKQALRSQLSSAPAAACDSTPTSHPHEPGHDLH